MVTIAALTLTVAGAIVVTGSLTPSAATASSPAQWITVTDDHSRPLGTNPEVRPGELLLVNVRGFGSRVPVEVRLVGDAPLAPAPRSDRSGVIHLGYRVPKNVPPGTHLLTFSGPGPNEAPAHTFASSGANLVATVPNVKLFAFHIRR